VVTALSQSEQNFQLSSQIGSRFPALVSATGRCIAAFGNYSESELRTRFDALRWDQAPSWDAWQVQVADAQRTGIAVDEGHYIAGVTVVAAPVWKAPREPGVAPSHALVAIGIGSALRGESLPRLIETLQAASTSLSAQLSG
jgi:DNA-binding IclR family transcriptional regulator